MNIIEKKQVIIYTDGSCTEKVGAGGYAAILIYKEHIKEIVGGAKDSTCNRMEMLAIIKALQKIKYPCDIIIYTDSNYVVTNISNIKYWRKNNWRKKDNSKVRNIDLWEILDKLMKIHNVKFVKVKAHSKNKYNNICDNLSRAQRKIFEIKEIIR